MNNLMHKKLSQKLISLLKNQYKNQFKNQLNSLPNNPIRDHSKSLKESHQSKISQPNQSLKISQFNKKSLKLITKQRIPKKMMTIKFFYKRLKCLNRCYRTKRKVLLRKQLKQKKTNKT